MNVNLLQATRSSQTAPRRGGRVTSAGSRPATMLLWHAGEVGEIHRPTPAVAMIDAEAPLACCALKTRSGRSGVERTPGGSRPSVVSFGSEGASRKVQEGTSCRNYEPAQAADPEALSPGTRWSQNGTGTRNPGNRTDTAPEGQGARRIISGRPGRMPRSSPITSWHNGTWTPPRALDPSGASRFSAACARRAGNRPSERPGQCPGHAESGDATSKCATQAGP